MAQAQHKSWIYVSSWLQESTKIDSAAHRILNSSLTIFLIMNLKPKLRTVSRKLFSDPAWIARRITGMFHPPLFSLQMGKVGSSSIKNTIESKYRVFHYHSQVEFEEGLKSLGNKYDGQVIDIITATRDPIGREISGFFQNITNIGHSYGVGTPEEVLSLGADRLIEIFKERWARRKWVPDTHLWFDRCFLPSTGINIYEHEFNRERGWDIVKSDKWRVLIVRFEDINRNYLEAINAFVTERYGANAAYPAMRQANVSSKKWYSEIMKEFKEKITFTPAEIAEQYDTQYCRHFYTPEEITKLKAKWPVQEDKTA